VVSSLTASQGLAGIELYPNPNQGQTRLVLPQSQDLFEVTVFNSLGQSLIPAQQLSSGQHWLDCSNLPNGLYLLSIRQNGQQLTKHLIVQRP
jgi:hypothetical protein